MEIKVYVQFDSSREPTAEDKAKIEHDIVKLIERYEDLVVGSISVKLL